MPRGGARCLRRAPSRARCPCAPAVRGRWRVLRRAERAAAAGAGGGRVQRRRGPPDADAHGGHHPRHPHPERARCGSGWGAPFVVHAGRGRRRVRGRGSGPRRPWQEWDAAGVSRRRPRLSERDAAAPRRRRREGPPHPRADVGGAEALRLCARDGGAVRREGGQPRAVRGGAGRVAALQAAGRPGRAQVGPSGGGAGLASRGAAAGWGRWRARSGRGGSGSRTRQPLPLFRVRREDGMQLRLQQRRGTRARNAAPSAALGVVRSAVPWPRGGVWRQAFGGRLLGLGVWLDCSWGWAFG
jgi:hypothetical protein